MTGTHIWLCEGDTWSVKGSWNYSDQKKCSSTKDETNEQSRIWRTRSFWFLQVEY